jgi:hypothetical protein
LAAETQLMRQHAHLSAVMSIVHDHVGKHGRAGRPGASPPVAPKLLNSPVWSRKSFRQHLRTTQSAEGQGASDLALRAPGPIEFCGQLDMWGGEP